MGALKRRIGGALALAAGVAALDYGPALAQPNETVLPEIAVTNTRLVGGARGARRGAAPGSGADVGDRGARGQCRTPPASSPERSSPALHRRVITAQEIERSPGQTLQDMLAREPGVQMTQPVRQRERRKSSVDMRGFGAAGTSNTLVLVNGRRLNDIDMAGVDFSAIPKNSIERIEITRGNSRRGALWRRRGRRRHQHRHQERGRPAAVGARCRRASAHSTTAEGNLSANTSAGRSRHPSTRNAISSDGYRENNKLRQENAVGDFRWTDGEGYHRLLQHLRRQPASRPAGRPPRDADHSELVTNRRGAATPFDFGDKHGINATLGMTRMLWQGTELVVDGGVRHKKQELGFFNAFGRHAASRPT